MFKRALSSRNKSIHGVDAIRPHVFMLYCDPLLQKAAEREENNPWGIFSKVNPKSAAAKGAYAKASEEIVSLQSS